MWGNTDAGVQIIEGADPLIIRNKLRKQQQPEGEKHQHLMPGEREQDASILMKSTSKPKMVSGGGEGGSGEGAG